MTLPRTLLLTPAFIAVCLGGLLTATPAATADAHGHAATRSHRAGHRAHQHRRRHIYIPRMLPTVIPAAREGYLTVLRGRASWYGKYFQGMLTANDERYDRFQYTCAHKTLPFNTRLRVTSVRNGGSVVVRVSDRGPFRRERILDLSEIAARSLNLIELGQTAVVAEIVPADTPLGPVATPAHLTVLVSSDPNPGAKFTAYLLPRAATIAAAAARLTTSPVANPAAVETALAPTAPFVAAAQPTALVTLASPAAGTPTAAGYAVQVGLFDEAAPADALRARLLVLNPALKPEVEIKVISQKTSYRVIIKQLQSWLAAETVRRNLQLWGMAGLVQTMAGEPAVASTLAQTMTPVKAAASR